MLQTPLWVKVLALFLNTFTIWMAKRKEYEKINRIRVVMVEKGITATELAEMVGVTPLTINRIGRNENQPTLRLLKVMAKALEVDIRELLYPTI